MLWLYRIICGELHIRIYGTGPERLLNIAAKNRLGLRAVRVNRDGIYAVMPSNKFKIMRKLLRKTGIRVHILKKRGIAFLLNKYRARSGFVAGLLIFTLALNFLSGFIWTVNVSGNVNVKETEIINACRRIGIYEGVRKSKINTTADAQEMLMLIPELAWGSLNIENCVLTVNVTEVKKSDRDKNGYPSNLKAKCDGIITGIDVMSGNVLVKIGDVVSKGDLLVSGVLENSDSSVFVRSKGSVTARIQKKITLSKNFKEKITVPVGETKKRTVLTVFGAKFPLYLGCVKKPYNSTYSQKYATLFNNKLPFGIFVPEFELLREKEVVYSYDELEQLLKQSVEKQTEKIFPNGAEICYDGITETSSGLTFERVVWANEKISFEDLILFDTIN